MGDKTFVASVFKTFGLDFGTLPNRIASQKTVYLLQELEGTNEYSFVWHNFGPYSSKLASEGFSLNEVEIENAKLLEGDIFDKFMQLKLGHERNSRFLELMADIIFIKKVQGVGEPGEIFRNVVEHRSYLNDPIMFKLALGRLTRFNLI